MMSSAVLRHNEGFGVVVPALGPHFDGLDESIDTGEGSSAEPPVGELFEPPLDQVEPGGRGGGEVEMPPLPSGMSQPLGHRRGFVSRQVVQHNMDVEVAGDVEVDQLEEPEDLFGAVPWLGVVDHLPGGHVESREQIGGAVPLVVMGHRPCPSRLQGKAGWVRSSAWTWVFSSKLNTTARSGGSMYNPTTSTQLLLEVGIVGDLEGVDLPRLEVMVPPDPSHGVLADPEPLSQRTGRPMCRPVLRCLFQRDSYHLSHRPFRQPRPTASSRRDPANTLHTLLGETSPPRSNRLRRGPTPASDLVNCHTIGCKQQRPGLNHLAVRQRTRTSHHLQRCTLLVGKWAKGKRSSVASRHTNHPS